MAIESWKAETRRYRQKIEEWPVVIAGGSTGLAALRLSLPLSVEPSQRETLAINLVSFASVGLRAATELTKGACEGWEAGRFVLVGLTIRLLFEFAAAMGMAAKAAELITSCDDLALANVAKRIDRLVGGARFPVALPWGGISTIPAINVQTFVDDLERTRPGATDDYAFLSAGSHPCHFQQFYLNMAGSGGDNWSNAVFAAHAHEILTRMVRIGNEAARDIQECSIKISDNLADILSRHAI